MADVHMCANRLPPQLKEERSRRRSGPRERVFPSLRRYRFRDDIRRRIGYGVNEFGADLSVCDRM
jgi:hypothetical protein